MNGMPGDNNRIAAKLSKWIFSRRGLLVLAGGLVVMLGLAIGLNVGGLREDLVWKISPPRIDSIAVLPFENLSHDPAQEYFADGVTAELASKLAQLGAFRVIDRPSLARYKKAARPLAEVAQELKIDAVVKGGVLRSGDRVRLDLYLTYAPGNRRLWQQTFERNLRDISGLEAEVSRAIALEIKARLSPQHQARLIPSRPVRPQVFEAYLKGTYGPESAKAEEYLKQAVQLDPVFAPAHAGLAGYYYWSNYFTELAPRDTYPKVKEAAQTAVRMDPMLADAHYYLALVAQEYDRDFTEAEREFRRALELNPNAAEIRHLYSHFLLCMDRWEESKSEDRRAVETDPLDPDLIGCLGWHSVATGDYDEAEKQCRQGLSMGASIWVRVFLGWSYERRGLYNEAILEFQRAVVGWGGAVFPTAALGHAYAAGGRDREAREVLDRLLKRSTKEYVSAYDVAIVYTGLGDRDRAFEWLEKAYEERSNSLVRFRMDPRIWSLRSDARFQDLLRRMNFPQDGQN